ncbi:MAG TPA: DUF2378 family protein [Kofleriaceae bacterium]|jgi:uncharacterized protein (TIGR02265 family)|nr:DUF2378 family protein [Kofleriaceae bacterium]
MSSKTVDGVSVGELVAAARPRLSADGRAAIENLGIPLAGKLAPTYPAEAWAACVKALAADLFPASSLDDAQRQLAHIRMAEFAGRVRGKLVFALSRLAPLDRSVERYAQGLRRATSYITTRFAVLAPGRYEIWISDVTDVPAFFAGMLEAGARRVGLTDACATFVREGDAATYELSRRPVP